MNSTSTAASPDARLASTARAALRSSAAVPTASVSHGWETGRGSSRARPLPAHSIVTGDGHGRRAPQLVERQHHRTLHRAADLEPPRRRVDRRDVVVDEQVVQADRRDRPAQRLQRHPGVARSELQLLGGDAPGRGHGDRIIARTLERSAHPPPRAAPAQGRRGYTATGQPVGSKTLAADPEIDCRPVDDPQRAGACSRSTGCSPTRTPRPAACPTDAGLPLLRRPACCRSRRRRARAQLGLQLVAPRGRRGDARDDRDALAGHEPAGDRLRAADRHRDDPPRRGPAAAAAGR